LTVGSSGECVDVASVIACMATYLIQLAHIPV
jgi:hypothetical protein